MHNSKISDLLLAGPKLQVGFGAMIRGGLFSSSEDVDLLLEFAEELFSVVTLAEINSKGRLKKV